MFQVLGAAVTRLWPAWLVLWGGALAALWVWAPSWDRVATGGQYDYLSPDAPTRRAEALFDRAFPGQRAASSIVLVLARTDGRPLQADDQTFLDQKMLPRLHALLLPDGRPGPGSPVDRIRAPDGGPTGALLKSRDGQAELVDVQLHTDFSDPRNWPVVADVEALVHDLEREGLPPHLQLAVTGSAVLARDTGTAEIHSARDIQLWTLVVVIVLLLVVYRAPLLALIPLVTVFVAIEVAVRLLALASQTWHLDLYTGVRIYVTVVGYGAGVDYCLFLIVRCKEEWQQTPDRTAVREAVARVGPAIAASAATVVIGIAMMGFADYGKIRQAGLGIAFSLAVVLTAALTLAPSILCLTGPWALWPWHRRDADRLGRRVEHVWHWVGQALARRPAAIGAIAVAAMAPFAIVAVLNLHRVSYDLTRNLPPTASSAIGLNALRQHFPAGATGPVIVLLEDDALDFRTPAGTAAIAKLGDALASQTAELDLADVRSLANPLGTSPAAHAALAQLPPYVQQVVHARAASYYVGGPDGHVTRLELTLQHDPFSSAGLHDLGALERALPADLPPSLAAAHLHYLGAAAGMRDLQTITSRDRTRVDFLVAGAVFAVLLVLLRQPVLSAYLILTVVFGYLTTLGFVYLVFRGFDGPAFPGLDWKVSFFLFTILVAVGEDYNIFLLTRIHEEAERRGPIDGVVEGLGKTGGAITSCGAIMAGTFASLLAGTLSELRQMGLALACGVLLDTIVIRPVLVPAFLLLRERLHM